MSRESALIACDAAKGKFDELRGLLLGPEREDIRQLKQSIASARRAEDISRVLPQAVRLASQRDRELRSALQPVIEQSIQISVRRNPRILSDVLLPMIGDAVKRAVASAMRQLNESLQQTLEQSFSSRGLLWRLEGVRTGRPFREIVLVRSLLYRVEQVFLIHRETGLLLVESSAELGVIQDADQVSAMLTAIQDFVKDSLGGQAGDGIETIEAGEFVIWIQQRPQLTLAALIRGAPPKPLKMVFESVLQIICSAQADALANFSGDVSPFQVCRNDLAACFLGKGKKARRRIVWWPAITAAVCAVILVASYIYFLNRTEGRWREFVGALRREPGIVVLEARKRGSKYIVSGLRDPLARDPALMQAGAGFSPGEVESRWQSYLSMQQPFTTIREFDELKKRLEGRKIYFSVDRAQLSPDQTSNLADTAYNIYELLKSAVRAKKKIKIAVIGHTDVSGTEARNSRLSEERARIVIASLMAAGVPSQTFSTQLIETVAPPSSTDSEWNRAVSRCVSFRVLPVQP